MKKDNFIVTIFVLTFILSIFFSTVSNVITVYCNEIVVGIILVAVIIIGIIFDIIGTSAITAHEATFHSMSSAKVKGAKETITLLKNASNISTICNDVVGDVCGIVSGALGAVLAISLANTFSINTTVISVVIAALISSMTVGGKAICKRIAISKCDEIIFIVGKIKAILRMK